MKIDLKLYAKELGYWIEAFERFIDHGSKPALGRLKEDLETGRDRQGPSFDWKLTKPIRSVPATCYDGKTKNPLPVSVGWQFAATFERGKAPRKSPLWTVSRMETHFQIFLASNGQEIMHFHHDMKNVNPIQLGPHIHMQLSEEFMKATSSTPIAVPRFPSLAMLPTDCLDFVLAEFFPHDWPKSQSGARGLNTLQAGQRKRLLAMAQELVGGWQGSQKTPLTAIQDCYMPNLQIA